MSEDPEDIKVKAIKHGQQVHAIQDHMEKRDALESEALGKMGAHQVKRVPPEKVRGMLKLALNTLKGISRDES